MEEAINKPLRDPAVLTEYICEKTVGKGECYVLLDEIQMVVDFEDVVNTLVKDRDLDIYITGSNSKFLSSDICTKFRGRGDRVHIQPLSFSEFSSVYEGRMRGRNTPVSAACRRHLVCIRPNRRSNT